MLPSHQLDEPSEIVRPSPVPRCLRVVDTSAWVKGWNSFAACSEEMPMPVSRTEIATAPRVPCARPATRTVAAVGELDRVVDQIRQHLAEPQRIAHQAIGHVQATCTRNSRFFSCAFCAVSIVAEAITSSRLKAVDSTSSLPASISKSRGCR